MDAETCFECGLQAVEDHHVVPVSRGGTRTVPLCEGCHGKVHELERSDRHACLVRYATKARAELGLWSGGRTPVGWRVEDDRLVPCAYEQRVIARILHDHGLGETVRGIRGSLYAARLWPRHHGTWSRPQDRARGHWSHGAIHNVIKRARAE